MRIVPPSWSVCLRPVLVDESRSRSPCRSIVGRMTCWNNNPSHARGIDSFEHQIRALGKKLRHRVLALCYPMNPVIPRILRFANEVNRVAKTEAETVTIERARVE